MEECELCADLCEDLVGCESCGRMVCLSCMAAHDDEDIEDSLCQSEYW